MQKQAPHNPRRKPALAEQHHRQEGVHTGTAERIRSRSRGACPDNLRSRTARFRGCRQCSRMDEVSARRARRRGAALYARHAARLRPRSRSANPYRVRGRRLNAYRLPKDKPGRYRANDWSGNGAAISHRLTARDLFLGRTRVEHDPWAVCHAETSRDKAWSARRRRN